MWGHVAFFHVLYIFKDELTSDEMGLKYEIKL